MCWSCHNNAHLYMGPSLRGCLLRFVRNQDFVLDRVSGVDSSDERSQLERAAQDPKLNSQTQTLSKKAR